jgi:hypothetical protein
VTRMLRIRFRRLIIVGAMGAGALALAVGTSAAASAATAGGYPTPSPSPTAVYTPPPSHHHHRPPPPVTHCFTSLETEHDTLNGEPVTGQQDQGYSDPSGGYGQQYGQPQDRQNHEPTIEVVQLVKVCVTEQRGHEDVVKVWDLTGPFAFEVPASGIEPTPHGLPNDIAGLLTK